MINPKELMEALFNFGVPNTAADVNGAPEAAASGVETPVATIATAETRATINLLNQPDGTETEQVEGEDEETRNPQQEQPPAPGSENQGQVPQINEPAIGTTGTAEVAGAIPDLAPEGQIVPEPDDVENEETPELNIPYTNIWQKCKKFLAANKVYSVFALISAIIIIIILPLKAFFFSPKKATVTPPVPKDVTAFSDKLYYSCFGEEAKKSENIELKNQKKIIHNFLNTLINEKRVPESLNFPTEKKGDPEIEIKAATAYCIAIYLKNEGNSDNLKKFLDFIKDKTNFSEKNLFEYLR